MAFLEAKNIDAKNRVICFARMKTGSIAIMRYDDDLADILRSLPALGPLFPYLRKIRACDRATEFKQRCAGLGIKGITLHSYHVMHGRSGQKAQVIQSVSHRRPLDITARPFTALMPARRKSNCRPWVNTNASRRPLAKPK